MTGKYEIDVYDNRVAYHLEIKRNITVIQGNSATGKTELVRLISDYNRGGRSSGITLRCEKECVALNALDWKSYLQASRDKIFFVDENNAFVKTKEFAEIVKSSDNYFVLIYRDSLPQLPYSIEEIYGMREGRVSQKYVGIKRVYNELYRLYNLEEVVPIRPNLVVTEDSNAGYECFEEIFPGKCISAGGRARVTSVTANAARNAENVLAVVDGAAFGADIQHFMRKCRHQSARCILFAPESFEYLLLSSGIVHADRDKLERTYAYADSKEYPSWERYYTSYLIELTEGTVYRYSKSHLNSAYMTEGNREKIIRQLPELVEIEGS